jgi:hypothetical protein
MSHSPLASDRRRIGLQSVGGMVTVCAAAHKLFSILCRLGCSCAPRSLTSPSPESAPVRIGDDTETRAGR